MTEYEKGKRDGLDFEVPSDIIVWVRAPDNDDMRRYLMGVIDGLRVEVAKLRLANTSCK
jgi:hypothetical protein